MKNEVIESLAAIAASLVVATAVGWAGSQNGVAIGGFPLFAGAAVFAFAAQWVVFVPSFLAQTGPVLG
jgi:hypothetical protein